MASTIYVANVTVENFLWILEICPVILLPTKLQLIHEWTISVMTSQNKNGGDSGRTLYRERMERLVRISL